MRRQLHARLQPSGDEGLSLIEVMVALMMLTVVSVSAAVLFVGGLRTTGQQSVKQGAIAVATRSLEALQSVPVSQVLRGRTQSQVQAMLSSPGMPILVSQDVTASDNFDPLASASSVAFIPVQRTETLDNVTYTVRTAVNRCYQSRVDKSCAKTVGNGGVAIYRATIRVSWEAPGCSSTSPNPASCSYAVSALLDGQKRSKLQALSVAACHLRRDALLWRDHPAAPDHHCR